MTGPTAAIGAPIVSKSAAEQVVTAPVLVPGQPDRERHQYRAENIQSVARSFLPDGQIDAMHAGGEVGHPTESYVAPDSLRFDGADRTVPAGAWVLSAKITDDDVWAGVESGDYQGVSVFGPVKRVLDDDGNQLDIQEIARPVGQSGAGATPAVANSFTGGGPSLEIPPAPVGETWTVEFERATHVSIVDDPAVQAASFVVAKSATSSAEQPIMDDEFQEAFEEVKTIAQKSAEQAEAAAESADEAQTAAEEAVDGDGDGGGGSDGLTRDDVRSIVSESVAEALGDDGGGGGDDLDIDADLDEETVEALTDGGVIDEETAEALGAPATGAEKRFATIEKKLDQLADGNGGRQGFASQLDTLGEDGEESGAGLVGSEDRAAAIKQAASGGGAGGDGE
jgi:hypothetical protein